MLNVKMYRIPITMEKSDPTENCAEDTIWL